MRHEQSCFLFRSERRSSYNTHARTRTHTPASILIPEGFMMSAAPALRLFLLACVLIPGHAGIIWPYSPPKTSNLSMTKNMCSDCTRIIELFSDLLSHTETQEMIQETLYKFCRRLPSGPAINDCKDLVQKYVPIVIQGFIAFSAHKEGEICMVLGLCAVQPEHKAPDLLNVDFQEAEFIQVQPSVGTSHELQISPQCTFCLFLIRKLEEMLPKERTEESVVKLLEKICDHLPDHYKEQCDDILEKYGKQILDFLLTSATPHTICTLLHLCLGQDSPALVPSLPSDCKTCKILMILTHLGLRFNPQIHLGQNTSETRMTSLLWKTCHNHPNALPGCEPFIQNHGTALVNILSKQEEAVNACQKYFCVGHE